MNVAIFNENLKVNSITFISANDNLILDTNGNGLMFFNIIVNNGCFFRGQTNGLSFN